LPFLEKRKVVIVAGFQGVSKEGQITTLGRGGSDTSAVALGVALEAEKVEFYKDVPGICSADPKVDPHARVYPYLSYEEAMEIVNRGAEILHLRAIELASKNHLPLHVLSFDPAINKGCEGTIIGRIKRSEEKVCVYEFDA
jgi:aspartate kinase